MSGLRLNIAQDLREVKQLCLELRVEAWHRSADKVMPGGDALVMIGPVANMGDWEERVAYAEFRYFADRADWVELDDDDTDPEPPLLLLAHWEDLVRAERGTPTDLRATIERAADYLYDSLDWMLSFDEYGDARFLAVDDFARRLSQMRARLEAVLKEGTRFDTSAAACFKDDKESPTNRCGGKLMRRTLQRRDCKHVERALLMAKGKADPVEVLRQMLMAFPEDEAEHKTCDQGGRDDVYRCYKCHGFYTEEEYWLAVREHYERQAG